MESSGRNGDPWRDTRRPEVTGSSPPGDLSPRCVHSTVSRDVQPPGPLEMDPEPRDPVPTCHVFLFL